MPQKQPKRGRLWLNDGSCIRLRPEHPNHVWSYDFVEDRTHNGRKFRMLNVIDEFTRECLAIRVEPEAEGRPMSSTSCRTCSSCAASRATFVPTMAPSSSPRPCASGSPRWEPGPPTSSPAARGRTAIARASTRSSATSCSTARSSTRCTRPRSSSKAGDGTTTPCARTHRSATDHPHQKPSHVAGCATRTSFAGHPGRSAKAKSCTNIQPGPPDGGRPRKQRRRLKVSRKFGASIDQPRCSRRRNWSILGSLNFGGLGIVRPIGCNSCTEML